jgi:hypothetical protein
MTDFEGENKRLERIKQPTCFLLLKNERLRRNWRLEKNRQPVVYYCRRMKDCGGKSLRRNGQFTPLLNTKRLNRNWRLEKIRQAN